MKQNSEELSLHPKPTFIRIFKAINYTIWNALAEFIDNSLESYQQNHQKFNNHYQGKYKLRVEIEVDIDGKKITITDNAAGISTGEINRAFRIAEPPPKESQLSEFGMGMKAAACWFSDTWEVRTTALGERIEQTIFFDADRVMSSERGTLEVVREAVEYQTHYTKIVLKDIQKISSRTSRKTIQKHLASIYREFIRNKTLELSFNQEVLSFTDSQILKAPRYDNPNGDEIFWKKNIEELDFGDHQNNGALRVSGFVALLETTSPTKSGLVLIRRGRVIRGGSVDSNEVFKPPEIFGRSKGTFRSKRLFGELHLEGFNVSFTKDGFQPDENFEIFLNLLADDLKGDKTFPILKQADEFRIKKNVGPTQAEDLVTKTKGTLEGECLKNELGDNLKKISDSEVRQTINYKIPHVQDSVRREFEVKFSGCEWKIELIVSYDPTKRNILLDVGDHLLTKNSENENRTIGIGMSLVHPLFENFDINSPKKLDPIYRICIALALSEVVARKNGDPPQEIRHYLNELLSGALSRIN